MSGSASAQASRPAKARRCAAPPHRGPSGCRDLRSTPPASAASRDRGQPKMSLVSSCSIGHGAGAAVRSCRSPAKNISLLNCQRSSRRHSDAPASFTQCGAPRSTNWPSLVVTEYILAEQPAAHRLRLHEPAKIQSLRDSGELLVTDRSQALRINLGFSHRAVCPQRSANTISGMTAVPCASRASGLVHFTADKGSAPKRCGKSSPRDGRMLPFEGRAEHAVVHGDQQQSSCPAIVEPHVSASCDAVGKMDEPVRPVMR